MGASQQQRFLQGACRMTLFEQSWEWGEFQKSVGNPIFRFIIQADGSWVPFFGTRDDWEGKAVVQVIERALPLGLRYWEASHGPVVNLEPELIVSGFQRLGRERGVAFVRWTPLTIQDPRFRIQDSVTELAMPKVLARQVPPRATLVIDLAKDEETLLKEMHEKTRYNIRLSERKGVTVVQADEMGFGMFWKLMQETAQRDRIGIHAKEYYHTMLKEMQGQDTYTRLFIAFQGEVPLATAILIICGDTATYLHGGSSDVQRNFMAPYLLQWRMMQFAKSQGCRSYDMWGVAPSAQQTQNSKLKTQNYGTWAGITRFKMGFGGEVREYAGTFDIVCKPGIYKLLSLGRRLKDIF